LLASGLAVGIVVNSMKEIPVAATAGGAFVAAGLALALDRFLSQWNRARPEPLCFELYVCADPGPAPSLWRKVKRLLSPALLPILAFIGCAILMPVKMPIPCRDGCMGPPTYTVRYLWPLDGTVNFLQFLLPANNPYSTNWYQSGAHGMSNLVVEVGIAGMFLMYLRKETAGNRGLQALGIFPFAALFCGLVFSHLPWCPVERFNLWDLIKDVPQWYGGLVFTLFALITLSTSLAFLERYLALVKGSKRVALNYVFVLGIMILVASSYQITKTRLMKSTSPAHFTRIGGHEDDVCADLAAKLWRLKKDTAGRHRSIRKVFVVSGSYFSSFYWHLPTYGLEQSYISAKDEGSTQTLRSSVPFSIVGKPSEIRSMAEKTQGIDFKEIMKFPRVGESLYLARGNVTTR
jgi:hypothetical protein